LAIGRIGLPTASRSIRSQPGVCFWVFLAQVLLATMVFVEVATRAIIFMQTQGRLGLVAYGGMLSLCTLCCLPTTPLEVAAGYLFPVAGSTAAGCVGKTIGCIAAFVVGRQLAGQLQLHRYMSKSFGPKIELMLRKRPYQTIGMIRGAPMPGAIKNFGLSLFPPEVVPIQTFSLITLLMNLPFSLAWSLAGNSCNSLQEAMSGGGNSAKTKQLLAQLAVLVFVLVGMSQLARHYKVHELLLPDPPAAPPNGSTLPMSQDAEGKQDAAAAVADVGQQLSSTSQPRRRARSPARSPATKGR
jgi:uncharacterized membrane protein YdjX (TVP38/TMEM64 family)